METQEKTEEVQHENVAPDQTNSESLRDQAASQVEAAPEGQQADASPVEESQEQINWRKFREERERERKEKAEAERRAAQKEEEARALQEALDRAMQHKGAPLSQAEQEQIVADLADDDIPMGRDIKGYFARIVEDTVEKRLADREKARKEEEARRAQQELPTKLRQTHSDFDQVMTQENVDYLEYHHPELAQAISYMPNGYDKWTNAYKLIKKMVPNAASAASDGRRAQQNLSKPQPGAAPTGQPSGEMAPGRRLSEAEKRANYERLMALAKGV